MLKAIFWDMDGTMVDSEPLWGIATYELSEKLGRRLTPELRATTVGGHFAHTFSVAAKWAGYEVKPGDEERYKTWMFSRMQEIFTEHLSPRPGIQPLLEDLHSRGIPMMVTTNTERSLANTEIDIVGSQYFVGSVCGDEVSAPKPDPSMYLTAAAMLGLDPAECLVFEDSEAGMTSALAAGCTLIAVSENPRTPIPKDALSLRDLHGSLDFTTVTAADIATWCDMV